jgi:hypothetical protein
MKRLLAAAAVLFSFTATPAFATQETFTSMQAADCSAGATCTQDTLDNLLQLSFAATSPLSGPTSTGFQVNAPFVDITANDPSKLLSASIVVLTVNQSTNFNGSFYIGSVMLSTQDTSGVWTDRAVWSMRIGNKPIYVLLNGSNMAQPLVQGVKAIRLSAYNGTTQFTVNMLNATPQ